MHARWGSVSADTRTKSGQATADQNPEVNVREDAVLLKQQTKTAEIEQAQSTRCTHVGHGVLYVQFHFSATKSGSFC